MNALSGHIGLLDPYFKSGALLSFSIDFFFYSKHHLISLLSWKTQKKISDGVIFQNTYRSPFLDAVVVVFPSQYQKLVTFVTHFNKQFLF